jgi:hypothetical protein
MWKGGVRGVSAPVAVMLTMTRGERRQRKRQRQRQRMRRRRKKKRQRKRRRKRRRRQKQRTSETTENNRFWMWRDVLHREQLHDHEPGEKLAPRHEMKSGGAPPQWAVRSHFSSAVC